MSYEFVVWSAQNKCIIIRPTYLSAKCFISIITEHILMKFGLEGYVRSPQDFSVLCTGTAIPVTGCGSP
jgi:hypothetical protein